MHLQKLAPSAQNLIQMMRDSLKEKKNPVVEKGLKVNDDAQI